MSNSMHHQSDDRSSYTFWTWLLAICLAIYLFWNWQHGHGPSFAASCCSGNTAAVSEPFSFSASSDGNYNSTGDSASINWAKKPHDLLDWLKGGTDWKASGDAKHVTLTGTVDSEATKTAKGEEAQAFFGSGVTIDNQLMVKVSQPAPAPVATVMSPPAAKVYFDTGKSSLPADVNQTIAPILEWMKNNPNAKVVISGFHDPRGNVTFNQALAKKRAVAVSEMLTQAGVNAANIELRKPQNTEGDGDLAEARRTEVSIE